MIHYLRTTEVKLKLEVIIASRVDVANPILPRMFPATIGLDGNELIAEERMLIDVCVFAPEHCPKLHYNELQIDEWIEQNPHTLYSITSFHSFLGLIVLSFVGFTLYLCLN